MIVTVCVKRVTSQVRGLLGRYLVEIESGVFIGDVSERVRASLWGRVTNGCGLDGSAWMIYPTTDTVQGMHLLNHNTDWSIEDMDGVMLVSRPLKITKQCVEIKDNVQIVDPGW